MNTPAQPAPITVDSRDCLEALQQVAPLEAQRREWLTLGRQSADASIQAAFEKKAELLPRRA